MINIDELLNKIDVDKLIEDYGKKEPEHLDADGVPINIGDVLYFAGDKCAFPDRAYIVIGFEADYGVKLKLPKAARGCSKVTELKPQRHIQAMRW